MPRRVARTAHTPKGFRGTSQARRSFGGRKKCGASRRQEASTRSSTAADEGSSADESPNPACSDLGESISGIRAEMMMMREHMSCITPSIMSRKQASQSGPISFGTSITESLASSIGPVPTTPNRRVLSLREPYETGSRATVQIPPI